MSGILQVIQDIQTQLLKVIVQNQEGENVPIHNDIWNNQIEWMMAGELENIPRPSAFIEIINDVRYEIMGGGFRNAHLGIRIHIVNEFYNTEGTFGTNLKIFGIRDKIVASYLAVSPGLSGYVPSGCSPLNCMSEGQQYDHKNIYHYILDFACNFVDSKMSPYDIGAGVYTEGIVSDLDQNTTVSPDPIESLPETPYLTIIPNYI